MKHYGGIIDEFITKASWAAYCGSEADSSSFEKLDSLTLEHLFPEGVHNQNMARCCLSGLWLLYNFLDRSHDISQEIKTPEGSFWHAIMHRIEQDFWNSKYWYSQVGDHPVIDELSQHAAKLVVGAEQTSAIHCGSWSVDGFVDLCEAERGTNGIAQSLACVEWMTLFDFCYKGAGGKQ